MSYKGVLLVVFMLCGLCLAVLVTMSEGQFYDLPLVLPPKIYGNLLINRTSEKNNVKPATFSHWVHRKKHTCRVCHFELGFSFKVNATEITEAENKEGKYCGAKTCHDGNAVFGHTKEHCDKCHNGDISYGSGKFGEFSKKLPGAFSGNEIDWVRAVDKGLIDPVKVLSKQPPSDLKFTKKLNFESVEFIPPAYFPHEKHAEWLDCNNCHPDIFRMKKSGDHFNMTELIKGEFCGLCHMRVAFPLDDCLRCHPGMKTNY